MGKAVKQVKTKESDTRTFLSPLLLGAVDVVFELDADLPLVGLVPDKGVLKQLVCRGALGVVLHQAALDETEELFGPVGIGEKEQRRVNGEKQPLISQWTLRFMRVERPPQTFHHIYAVKS